MRHVLFALFVSIVSVFTRTAYAHSVDGFDKEIATFEPRSMNEGLAATSLESANKKWSFGFFVQGSGKQSGAALEFQTPLAWNFIGLRVAYAGNQVSVPISDHVTLGEVIAGVKIQLNQASSTNMFTYIIENFDFYVPMTGDTAGSKNAYETALGIEWRHYALAGANHEIEGAAYVEGAQATSYLRTGQAVGGDAIGDGFVARLGFRRFF